jgi:hypothetical protein
VPLTGVGAVVLNVTVSAPTASGFLTVYPNGAAPSTSNLNFVAGQTVPNLVVAPVGSNGVVDFTPSLSSSTATVQIIADISGWLQAVPPPQPPQPQLLPAPGGLQPFAPQRILDTRSATGVSTRTPLGPGKTLQLPVLGHGPVPASGVGAVALNVTVTAPTANGFLTVYPDGVSRPGTSNLNFSANQTVPNMVVAPVGSDGSIDFYNGSGGTVHVIADVSGWLRTP